jgi:hypothetical protein
VRKGGGIEVCPVRYCKKPWNPGKRRTFFRATAPKTATPTGIQEQLTRLVQEFFADHGLGQQRHDHLAADLRQLAESATTATARNPCAEYGRRIDDVHRRQARLITELGEAGHIAGARNCVPGTGSPNRTTSSAHFLKRSASTAAHKTSDTPGRSQACVAEPWMSSNGYPVSPSGRRLH